MFLSARGAPSGATNYFMASVKRYPRMVLSTPGTSGYRLSYKRVLRVVPHKPPKIGYLLTEVMICRSALLCRQAVIDSRTVEIKARFGAAPVAHGAPGPTSTGPRLPF